MIERKNELDQLNVKKQKSLDVTRVVLKTATGENIQNLAIMINGAMEMKNGEMSTTRDVTETRNDDEANHQEATNEG